MLPTVLVVQFIYRCMLSTRVRQAVPAGGHFRASRWGLLFRTDLLSGPSFMHVPGHKLCKLFVSSTCCNTCVLQVWEEGSSSEAGAVRLYAPEIVTLLVEGLGSQQWGRKQASAQAVVRLTEVGAAATMGKGLSFVQMSSENLCMEMKQWLVVLTSAPGLCSKLKLAASPGLHQPAKLDVKE
eukprot:1158084-Pelagomonas_calceolata.AAC.6